MKLARFVLPLFVSLAVTVALAATDVSGTWSGPMDSGGEAVFHLKAEDKGIGGTMTGADGKEYPVSSGKLDGDKVSLTVDSQWQGMPVKLLVNGTLSGDTMQLHIASDNGYWQTDAKVKKQTK